MPLQTSCHDTVIYCSLSGQWRQQSVSLPSYIHPVWSSAGSPSDIPQPAPSAPELLLPPDTAWKSEHTHTHTHTHTHRVDHHVTLWIWFSFSHREFAINWLLSSFRVRHSLSFVHASRSQLLIICISVDSAVWISTCQIPSGSITINSTLFDVWQN